MKSTLITLALLGLVGATSSLSPRGTSFIKGDYVEARTASVFAGACHYNSEYMTTGRDAIMAWNITDGAWNGTSLAGVRVVAVVSADDNLADAGVRHRSSILVDRSATAQQVAAVTAALEAQCGPSLGKIDSVRTAAIQFTHQDNQYDVTAAGFARLSVKGMPDDECCKQPGMVWYAPLAPLSGAKVGYTVDAACSLGQTWDRQAENGAFYGTFNFAPAATPAIASAAGM